MRPVVCLAIVLVATLTACAGKRREPPPEPTAAQLADICARQACRPATKVRLPIDATRVYEVPFPASPYIAGPGIVSVLPGEKIHFAATVQKDGKLADLRVVDEAQADVHVEFTGEPGMSFLTVRHDWERVLLYCAGMQLAGRTDFLKTSIVPVQPNLYSSETWSDPIVQLVLHEFRLVDPADAVDCR